MTRLTRERERRGWSRTELARRAEVHPSDIGKFEARRLLPYEGQLQRIAKTLGWPMARAEALLEKEATG